jgi:DnaJ-class molecular chaperone
MTIEPSHFTECTGNGSEPCWDCGGDGFYSVPEDDDPMGDLEYQCETCAGKGVVVCPGCEAMRHE